MNYYKDCINCLDRVIGCSQSCSKYRQAKQAHAEEKQKIRQEREIDCAIAHMVIKTIERNRRRNGVSTYSYKD